MCRQLFRGTQIHSPAGSLRCDRQTATIRTPYGQVPILSCTIPSRITLKHFEMFLNFHDLGNMIESIENHCMCYPRAELVLEWGGLTSHSTSPGRWWPFKFSFPRLTPGEQLCHNVPSPFSISDAITRALMLSVLGMASLPSKNYNPQTISSPRPQEMDVRVGTQRGCLEQRTAHSPSWINCALLLNALVQN